MLRILLIVLAVASVAPSAAASPWAPIDATFIRVNTSATANCTMGAPASYAQFYPNATCVQTPASPYSAIRFTILNSTTLEMCIFSDQICTAGANCVMVRKHECRTNNERYDWPALDPDAIWVEWRTQFMENCYSTISNVHYAPLNVCFPSTANVFHKFWRVGGTGPVYRCTFASSDPTCSSCALPQAFTPGQCTHNGQVKLLDPNASSSSSSSSSSTGSFSSSSSTGGGGAQTVVVKSTADRAHPTTILAILLPILIALAL